MHSNSTANNNPNVYKGQKRKRSRFTSSAPSPPSNVDNNTNNTNNPNHHHNDNLNNDDNDMPSAVSQLRSSLAQQRTTLPLSSRNGFHSSTFSSTSASRPQRPPPHNENSTSQTLQLPTKPPLKRKRTSRFAQAKTPLAVQSSTPLVKQPSQSSTPSLSSSPSPPTIATQPLTSTLSMKPSNSSAPKSFDLTSIPIAPPKTIRINQKVEKKQKLDMVLKISEKDFLDTNPRSNPYFDPALRKPPRAPRPLRKELNFVDQGTIAARAEQEREKAAVQKRRDEFTAKLTDKNQKSELPILPPLAEDLELSSTKVQVPDLEWWDLPFLVRPNNNQQDANNVQNTDKSTTDTPGKVVKSNKTLEDRFSDNIQLREERITHYVHHPVPIKSAKPNKTAPVIPLMLTKKETKKLRRQRRMEMQKEQQDMIAAGLLPPLPPKVKVSNMMRVLTTETSVDPTKMEAEVRAQVEARRLKHEADNEARKKSGEERREKARQKREKDKAKGLHAAVYRVVDLSFAPHRFKIDRNAKQLQLTGVIVLFPGCNVVVVEGGAKALRKYKALMLRRINWKEASQKKEHKKEEYLKKEKEENMEIEPATKPEQAQESDKYDDDDEIEATTRKEDDDSSTHGCALVWEGVISTASFDSFGIMRMRDEEACRSMFNSHRVEHYWDLCLQASPMGNNRLGVRQV